MDHILEGLKMALAERYAFERELGRGGMATVYLAHDRRHDRRVAVKVLSAEVAAAAGSARFLREIDTVAKLTHPHILPLHDSGEVAGVLYYVMPYVEGESLRDRLNREKQLSLDDAIRIAGETADALNYAHSRGVVHRDIKPENILLEAGHAVVSDFGIARAIGGTGEQLTQTGIAIGTPAYMSPEQASGATELDGRSDTYSLACVAYEMLAGEPPFTGPTAESVLHQHLVADPPSVTGIRPRIPPDIADVLRRALSKTPADRYATAAQFSEALERAHIAPPRTAGRESWFAQVSAPVGLYLAASLAVLGIVRELLGRTGLPDWVLPAAAVLLLVGFPIVLATAVVQRRQAREAWSATHWLTWRKAVGGGVAAFAALGLGAVVHTGMRVWGVGPPATLIATGALDARDRLIVADLEDRAGDPLLAAAVTEALRVDLTQSRAVRLVEPADIAQALSRMGRQPTVPLDAAIAREIAAREGVKALVTGEVNAVGAGYVLSARLVAAEDGRILVAMRETADDSTHLIDAIDKLSARLRERAGESLRTIRASPPLAQVTTSSLPALRAYSQAVRAIETQSDPERAIALLEQAVTEDTAFAMAYRKLGVVLGNLGLRPQRQVEARTRAYELRARLTERERYLVIAARTPFSDEAFTAYRTLLDLDPDDVAALNNLAVIHRIRGDYAGAEEFMERAAAIDRTVTTVTNLAGVQLAQGKFDAARATVEEALRDFPAAPEFLEQLAAIAFARGDYAGAVTQLQSLAARAQSAHWTGVAALGTGAVLATQGKLRLSERYFDQVTEVMARQGLRDQYLLATVWRATLELAAARVPVRALARVDDALRRFPLESLAPREQGFVYWELSRFYAAAGRPDRARALVVKYDGAYPPTELNRMSLAIVGAIALAEGRTEEATAYFQRAVGARASCPTCFLPYLGRAHDLAGARDSAIAVYERYVSSPPYVTGCCFLPAHPLAGSAVWLALTYLRLGELYAEQGEPRDAVQHYSRFVDLWTDADPELQPLVEDVRKRILELVDPRR